ncbi:hypothetical protein PC118_g16530 [Phytophthora cactorum]|uniref:Uncharacterized protein n=1 Tax=Phytophthora cactorum TaxID=29920 RepID=A0A8T1FFY0_9STRA|nr:hypothetical protein PC118_g16530 [Phytophthora cactorum]KAG3169035.1 hypothetical protein PC128_g19237 [Phytophthora cactorum]
MYSCSGMKDSKILRKQVKALHVLQAAHAHSFKKMQLLEHLPRNSLERHSSVAITRCQTVARHREADIYPNLHVSLGFEKLPSIS